MAEYTSAAKARKRAASGKVKAAVWVGRTPVTDDPFAKVATFELVKDAEAEFRRKREEFIGQGYEQTYGTLGRGMLLFEQGSDKFGLFLDKRR